MPQNDHALVHSPGVSLQSQKTPTVFERRSPIGHGLDYSSRSCHPLYCDETLSERVGLSRPPSTLFSVVHDVMWATGQFDDPVESPERPPGLHVRSRGSGRGRMNYGGRCPTVRRDI